MRRKYEVSDYDFGRDSITIDEVITRLRRIERGWIPDWNYTGEDDDYENYLDHVALWKAVEILKEKAKGN